MSRLPHQFKDEALKTLGPPIRKDEEKKPVEEHIGNNVWRVNGRLETRIDWEKKKKEEEGKVDIPLPDVSEFKPVWRKGTPTRFGKIQYRWPAGMMTLMDQYGTCTYSGGYWDGRVEWLDEGR